MLRQGQPNPLAAFAALLGSADGAGTRGRELLVAAAHPDDETLWLGAQLSRLRDATIVHVTDGAPRNGRDARASGFSTPAGYAAARRRELEEAVALAGMPPERLLALGFPDGEAARNMAAIARALLAVLRERRPGFVLTHPFEGGHPDHDACALAVHAACLLLTKAGEAPPAILEAPSYHLGPEGPVWGGFAGAEPVLELPLRGEARARKERMLAAHASQARILANFPLERETFRAAPAYDFSGLPNGGRLLYASLPLDFSGSEWPSLADRVFRELGLPCA